MRALHKRQATPDNAEASSSSSNITPDSEEKTDDQ